MGRESGNGSGFESKESTVSGNPLRRIIGYFKDEASAHSAEQIWSEVGTYYSRPDKKLVEDHMGEALDLLDSMHPDEEIADKIAKLREILRLPVRKDV